MLSISEIEIYKTAKTQNLGSQRVSQPNVMASGIFPSQWLQFSFTRLVEEGP